MEKLELQFFEPLVGDAFRVTPSHQGEPFDVVLTAAEPTPFGDPATYNGRRLPFSLIFHANDGTHVPQQICTFAHDGAGGIDLFVVPLGPEGGAMRYEAVIS
jgi:hypothetical protein